MLRFLLAALLALPLSAHAATLIVQDGQLMGATGINIDGVLYDIQFTTGTCAEFYSGCDEQADFAAVPQRGAPRIILTDILVDGPLGNFDSQPELTNGCDYAAACSIFVPYFIEGQYSYVSLSEVYNVSYDGDELVSTSSIFDTPDLQFGNGRSVLAIWKFSDVTTVPLPATGALMLVALAGVAVAGRRRR